MAELASVREDFDAAVAFVAKPPASVVRHVDNEEKLIFYGLFKQATVVRPPPRPGAALCACRLSGHAPVAGIRHDGEPGKAPRGTVAPRDRASAA